MRICIFTDSFLPYFSGVTYAVLNQASELVRRGHEVYIFRPKPWHSKQEGMDDVAEGVKIVNLPCSIPIPNVPKLHVVLPTFLYTIYKLLRLRPDVIHLNTEWGCGWEGVVAGRMMGIPAVGTFHTFFAEPGYLKAFGLPNNKIMRNIMWNYSVFFYSRCHALTSPSAAVKNALVAHGVKTEPAVVSNGIELPELIESEAVERLREEHELTGPTFAYIGRISPEKSLDVLLKAFAKVSQERDDARLAIVGDGPYRFKLRRQIKQLGISEKTVQFGFVPHDELIAQNIPRVADIFITASKTENQPMSILEAMAFGLPIVGARAKGIPELVEDGRDGLLFEPDDVDDMAAQMLASIQDPTALKEMSNNALLTADAHTIERTVDRLEDVYLQAIEIKRGTEARERASQSNQTAAASAAPETTDESPAATPDPDNHVASATAPGEF